MRLKGKKIISDRFIICSTGTVSILIPCIVSDYSGNRDELLFMAYVDRKGICRYTEL